MPAVRRIAGFTAGSGAGLVIDLGGFALLTAVGVLPFLANLVTSAAAITTVYFLVTRYAFRARPTWRTYVTFITWYGASALLVSAAISLIGEGSTTVSLVVKLASVPVTFSTNYVFGHWLFAGGAERFWSALGDRSRHFRRTLVDDGVIDRVLGTPSMRRTRAIAASLATAVFVILVLPMNEGVSFHAPADQRGVVLQHLLEIGFTIALWLFALFLVRFGQAVWFRSRRHRRWLVAAAAYLAVNLVVLAMIYPGHWVDDEFYTLQFVKAYSVISWQGYLTNVFYTFSLYLAPTPVAILLVQLVAGALISGYAISTLQSRLRRPWLAYLLALPLLSFPTLLNNQYPLRLTMYAYLLVLLVVRLFVLAGDRRPTGRPWAFAGTALLIGVLAFWRNEGVYLLLFLPVAFVLCDLHRLIRVRPTKVAGAVVAMVAVVGVAGYVTDKPADPKYQMSAFINPLSTMLQGKLQGPRLEQDLATINTVLDLKAVKAQPMYRESAALANGGVRPDFTEHLNKNFYLAYADLVAHNPGPFLQNRIGTFGAANSLDPSWLPQVWWSDVYDFSAQILGTYPDFEGENFLTTPIHPYLKQRTELTLLMWTRQATVAPLGPLVWTSIPVLALAVAFGVIALARRRWTWATAFGIVLANAVLVFLTSPSSYFMYYFPAYLTGGLLACAAVVAVVDRRLALRRRPRPAVEQRSLDTEVLVLPELEHAPEVVGAR